MSLSGRFPPSAIFAMPAPISMEEALDAMVTASEVLSELDATSPPDLRERAKMQYEKAKVKLMAAKAGRARELASEKAQLPGGGVADAPLSEATAVPVYAGSTTAVPPEAEKWVGDMRNLA